MTKTYVLKKLPLWPVIRISFVLFLIIGILIGIFYALIVSSWGFLAGSLVESPLGNQFGILRGLGFILIPVIAVLYAIFGTIVAAIWVLIYNLISSVVGGIEIALEPTERQGGVPPRAPASEGAHVPPDKTITGF
jgi:hypothetical protein